MKRSAHLENHSKFVPNFVIRKISEAEGLLTRVYTYVSSTIFRHVSKMVLKTVQ